MRNGLLIGAFFIIFIIIAPVSGAEIIRTVMKGDTNTIEVRLAIAEGSVLGITETLPDGANVTFCSLPAEQYLVSTGGLHLAVIDEKEISYTLQGGNKGPVSGTWTDFSDGSTGTVLAQGQTTDPSTEPSLRLTPAVTQAAGADVVCALGALCIGIAVISFRREGL